MCPCFRKTEFNLRRCLVRSVLLAAAVVIGELVPRFDLVMGVIGGTLTGPLIFVLPPLFYSKIVKLESEYDRELARFRRNRTTLDDDDSEETTTTGSYGTFVADSGPAGSDVRVWTQPRLRGGRWCTNASKCVWDWLCSDGALSFSVIVFGLTATAASTYFSAVHITTLKEFWSPCIHNISYSFRDL